MKMHDISRFSLFTEVIFGLHSSTQLGLECKKLGAKKVAVVTDKAVGKILSEALESLNNHKIAYIVLDHAPVDPDTQIVSQLVGALKEDACDLIVTAGGGSAMCAGKGTALLATNNGNIRDYHGRDKYRNPPLPCIAIPTTAGSGSEVSKATIITDEQTNLKMAIVGLSNAPRVAILDPLLLTTLPRHQAIASGVDALCHSIEALCSRYATPLTDGIALTAAEMIASNFSSSVLGDDLDAKGEMLFASAVANIACGNAGLGLCHALNSALTYLYKAQGYEPVAYGDIHAICLPLVMEFNLPAAETKFAALARALGLEEDMSMRELAIASIRRVKELLAYLNTCRKLPWRDIPSNEIEEVAKLTLSSVQAVQNPRKASESEIVSMIQKALKGWEMS